MLGNLRFWPLRAGATAPAAHRFREPIRWLAFSDSDVDAEDRLIVQTQQWLHEVQLGRNTRIERSRLLPPGLEAGAAQADTQRWRLLGSLLLGRVEVVDVEFDAPGSVPAGSETERDEFERFEPRAWGSILGLELDAQGIAIPVIHQAQN